MLDPIIKTSLLWGHFAKNACLNYNFTSALIHPFCLRVFPLLIMVVGVGEGGGWGKTEHFCINDLRNKQRTVRMHCKMSIRIRNIKEGN
jgi:hypothetical protein